jgi:hypothetical protein
LDKFTKISKSGVLPTNKGFDLNSTCVLSKMQILAELCQFHLYKVQLWCYNLKKEGNRVMIKLKILNKKPTPSVGSKQGPVCVPAV